MKATDKPTLTLAAAPGLADDPGRTASPPPIKLVPRIDQPGLTLLQAAIALASRIPIHSDPIPSLDQGRGHNARSHGWRVPTSPRSIAA